MLSREEEEEDEERDGSSYLLAISHDVVRYAFATSAKWAEENDMSVYFFLYINLLPTESELVVIFQELP